MFSGRSNIFIGVYLTTAAMASRRGAQSWAERERGGLRVAAQSEAERRVRPEYHDQTSHSRLFGPCERGGGGFFY